MRDPGLLVGEFETPLSQEVFHERLDFIFAGEPRDVPVMMKSSAYRTRWTLPPARRRRVSPKRRSSNRLQSIQGPIRQGGGDDPALRCPFRGGEQDVLLQETGLQPLPEHLLVHGDLIQQPSVTDPIKAGFDVAFEDPASRPWWTSEDLVTLIQGIGTAALQPKAIGMAVGQRFRDGIETEQVEGLHGAIGHCGYP